MAAARSTSGATGRLDRLAIYKVEEVPELFARQLGIKPDSSVASLNAPSEFMADLERGKPLGSRIVTGNAMSIFSADIVLFWPEDLGDAIKVINWRLKDSSVPLTGLWVVIPKKPVAQQRDSDLLFQDILDPVLPTGLVDNKTLTFSDEEYGIRFVPRRAIMAKPSP